MRRLLYARPCVKRLVIFLVTFQLSEVNEPTKKVRNKGSPLRTQRFTECFLEIPLDFFLCATL